MKNTIKSVGILALVAVIGFIMVACSGAAPASDFNYVMNKDNNGVKITKYIGKGGKVVIPAKIEGYPVVELGSQAFYGEDNTSYGPGYSITSVVIPASVKFIGNYCFYSIDNLKSVTFLGTGVVIDANAFAGNSNLKELKMPSGDNVLIPHVVFGVSMSAAFSRCKALPLSVRSRLNAMGFTEI